MIDCLRQVGYRQEWLAVLMVEASELSDDDLDCALRVIYSEYIAREQKKAAIDGRGTWTGS